MRIDSHQHFWQYDPAKHGWIDASMGVIQRDFMPGDLQKMVDAYHLNGTIAVQAEQTEEETHFLLDLAEKNKYIKGVVGWVDLQSDSIEERLEYFAQFDKLVGFRHLLQDEIDPNFICKSSFINGLKALEKYGFTYDVLIYPPQLKSVIRCVGALPEQRFVIDHLAKPRIGKGEIEEWSKLIKQIGDFENVYCKLSGLVTEANWSSWQGKEFTPYLDTVVDSFGVDKLMFGSDWPVCLLTADYAQVLDIVEDYFGSYPASDRAKIFGQNAIDFYRLGS